MGTKDDALCVCGHPRRAHEHYRAGSECSLCRDASCARFRPAGGWWRRFVRGA